MAYVRKPISCQAAAVALTQNALTIGATGMLIEQKDRNRALGKALADARVSLKWPQTLASKKLGITSTYLSALENGRVTASLELVAKAERLYGAKILEVMP